MHVQGINMRAWTIRKPVPWLSRLCCAMLQAYARKRILRASTIHGLAGMAAIAASTYKAYLGEGLGPLSFLKQLRIPHPGRVRVMHQLRLCDATRPVLLKQQSCMIGSAGC